MRARRMIGQGAILDGIFNNLALDGVLQLQGQTLTSNKMTLRAAKLRSQLVILADLATGRFNAALVGDIKGLLIPGIGIVDRSEEHTSELQSLMRISYAVFCLKQK